MLKYPHCNNAEAQCLCKAVVFKSNMLVKTRGDLKSQRKQGEHYFIKYGMLVQAVGMIKKKKFLNLGKH